MKVHIRRQVTKVGALRAFKLPKGGKERTIPLSRGLAAVVRAQIAAYPPQPYTLPWLAEDGKVATDPHTCRLLFRWFGDDPRSHGRHILPSSYDQQVWKPALHRAGVIGEPVRDKARALRYPADRRDGMHALRHFYSTTLQDAGVSLAGVMDFMGHSREGKGVPLTLGVYGHVTEETFEQGRQAIDRTLFRLRPVESSGTVTELRAAR
jgi:integrase